MQFIWWLMARIALVIKIHFESKSQRGLVQFAEGVGCLSILEKKK
jgi:hypothetical protein